MKRADDWESYPVTAFCIHSESIEIIEKPVEKSSSMC